MSQTVRDFILFGLDVFGKSVELGQHLLNGSFQGLDIDMESVDQWCDQIKACEFQAVDTLAEIGQVVLQAVDEKLRDRIECIDRSLEDINHHRKTEA